MYNIQYLELIATYVRTAVVLLLLYTYVANTDSYVHTYVCMYVVIASILCMSNFLINTVV